VARRGRRDDFLLRRPERLDPADGSGADGGGPGPAVPGAPRASLGPGRAGAGAGRLLSTLTALVPYAFSAIARLRLLALEGHGASRPGLVVAAAAFCYSFWAIAGAGEEVVYLGFLLLLAGLPIYAWLTRKAGRVEVEGEAGEGPA
jgi:hypothetical protein